MRFRDHPATAGKRDFYGFDPRQIKVDPSYNVRDLTTPEAKAKLAELRDSIIANGVRVPLEVRIEGEDVYVVAGHRRLAAVMAAIAEGHEIKSIPVIPEPLGTNEVERTLNLVVSNSGEPLSPLEIAQVIKRLLDFGWTDAQVATRLGWKSTQQVKNHLDLLGAPADVREMVRKGHVSASTAVRVARREGAGAGAILRDAKSIAEKQGKAKVTPRAVRAAQGESQLAPKQVAQLIAALQKIKTYEDEPRSCRLAGVTLSKLGVF